MNGLSNIGSRNDYGDVYAGGQAQLIVGNVYQQTPAAELTKEQRCHQVFKTSSYENHKDRNPRRVAGTCRWALDNQQFLDWRDSPRSALLWISADPGCGKSVLSRALIDEVLPSGRSSTVCYFFFKDNEEQDNLQTALCALLHQLFTQQPHLLRHATSAWQKNGDMLRRETSEMWRILQASATDSSANPIICILDALDECKDIDRRQLIDLLCDLQYTTRNRPSAGILKVLATSRPYDNVQRWFEPTISVWPQIRLRGEDENDQIHQEINLVIEQRLQDLTQEYGLSVTDSESLRQQLLHMQHRTYLWLHLAMEEVRESCQDSIYGEELRIVSLPTSVEDAYERILGKIKDRQRTRAHRILLIIVGARRPLSIGEMAIALGVAQAGENNQSSPSRIEPTRLEKQIREQCGLFVFINHSQLFLIHQTAKEFLVAQNTNTEHNSHLWKSCLQESQVEYEMTTICVTYLSMCDEEHTCRNQNPQQDHGLGASKVDSKSQALEDADRFFRYCSEHWNSHLRDEFVQQNDGLSSKVLRLYRTDTDFFQRWFLYMWKAVFPYEAVPHLYSQHLVAITGHSFILQKIIHDNEQNIALEAQDSKGRTALHWAAWRGHEKVVRTLVTMGADINAQGEEGNALQLGSLGGHEGHEKVLQILIDAGADVNARNEEFDHSPLQIASSSDNERIVQILLAAGADVNADGALNLASSIPYEKIVQILLSAGADVNGHNRADYTSLFLASSNGHEQIVQILLDAGADVNAKAINDEAALKGASRYGHTRVVQILLDAGAEVNAKSLFNETAILEASRQGYKDVVETLLDAGADVNIVTTYKDTALLLAAEDGYEKIVQILLDAGASANINFENEDGETALQRASNEHHEGVVQLLLKYGAKDTRTP